MTTLYLALDATGSLAHLLSNGFGVIAAMDKSEAALRARGFNAPDYTGDRLVTIDTTDDSVWDNDCVPGWNYNNGVVAEGLPVTKVQRLRNGLYTAYGQLDAWGHGLNAQALGQPAEKVATGHDYLWRKRGGLYLISRDDTTYTIDQRIAWVEQVPFGALDIDSVFAFYTHFSGLATDNWISWVNPSNATRLNLAESFVVPGNVPGDVNLALTDWIATVMQ